MIVSGPVVQSRMTIQWIKFSTLKNFFRKGIYAVNSAIKGFAHLAQAGLSTQPGISLTDLERRCHIRCHGKCATFLSCVWWPDKLSC